MANTNLINKEIQKYKVPKGRCHVFIQHTSASLLIIENADPDARVDLKTILIRWSLDTDPKFLHIAEGPDDTSAHARNMLT